MKKIEQLTTFYIDGELFGIEVLQVQEVTGQLTLLSVPLSPPFIRGLVNLRGQIATALGLREIFEKPVVSESGQMSVICRIEGNLIALIVDSIGDVLEIANSAYEPVPSTIPLQTKKFLKGIYKMNGDLLSIIDLEAIAKEFSPTTEAA